MREPLFIWCALSALAASVTQAATVTPYRARTFHNSVGVCTHLSYGDTPYADNWDEIKIAIRDLGVRHIRDNFHGAEKIKKRFLELYNEQGVRACLMVNRHKYQVYDPGFKKHINDNLREMIDLGVYPAIEAIEGPNEFDSEHFHRPDWVDELRAFQQHLYNRIKGGAYPQLQNRLVIAPSMQSTWRMQFLGDMSGMVDRANAHPYPGSNYPSSPDAKNMVHYTNFAPDIYPSRRKWATESGYHNGTTDDPNNNRVSPDVAARYLPRLLADNFRRGVVRTYIYELCEVKEGTDRTRNWGLINTTGTDNNYSLSRKPAFRAVRALISKIKDGAEKAQSFEKGALRLSYDGKDSSTRTLLLQKTSGDYWLLLWRGVESPTAVTDRLTVNLGTPIRQAVLHSYNSDYWFDSQDLAIKSGSVALNVGDKLTLLELKVSGDYRIVNRFSGKPIEAAEPGRTDGSNVRQWGQVAGAQRQIWRVRPQADGSIRIRNRANNGVLEPATWDSENGDNVRTWSWLGTDKQRWLTERNAGFYRIRNRHSGKLVQIQRFNDANGVNVRMWEDTGGEHKEHFRFVNAQ